MIGKWVTEFIGTFFLVLTVLLTHESVKAPDPATSPPAQGGSQAQAAWQIKAAQGVTAMAFAPLAIGSVLMVMVYMGGHVSGGHYNPAVSLAVLVRGRVGIIDFVMYVISQVLGAVAAAGMAFVYTGKTLAVRPNHADLQRLNLGLGEVVLAEAIFTFALALVVLNAATSKRTANNSYYGLAIGFTVFVGAMVVGGLTGGAFNPAVATGPTAFDVYSTGSNAWRDLWIYWVGPPAGGLLAALVFYLQEAATPAPSAETR
jgi:aquaporin Z